MIKFSTDDVMKTVLGIIAEDTQVDEATGHEMKMKFKDRVKKAIDLKKKDEPPKKPVKEEIENIDEVSKKTLGKYIKKSSLDASERAYGAGIEDSRSGKQSKPSRNEKNRDKGVDLAVKKLTGSARVNAKEDTSYDVIHAEYGNGKTIPGQMYEDMTVDVMFEEQIILGVPMDELEVIE